MDYSSWLKMWNDSPSLRQLVGSDPNQWTQDIIERVNNNAEEEMELFNRLMKLSDKEFYDELDRLSKEEEE